MLVKKLLFFLLPDFSFVAHSFPRSYSASYEHAHLERGKSQTLLGTQSVPERSLAERNLVSSLLSLSAVLKYGIAGNKKIKKMKH